MLVQGLVVLGAAREHLLQHAECVLVAVEAHVAGRRRQVEVVVFTVQSQRLEERDACINVSESRDKKYCAIRGGIAATA